MAVGSLDSARFALDVKGLDGLKHAAGENPKQQIEAAARQFEALFINQMLKSMRAAGVQSDLTDSKDVRFYQSLLDQQRSQSLAEKGIGLADMLVRQLSGRDEAKAGSVTAERIAAIPRGTPRSLTGVAAAPAEASTGEAGQALTRSRISETPTGKQVPALSRDEDADSDVCDRFVQQFSAAANAAARRSGVPARLILAQAALESGWGRHEISSANGGNSHNLFGIKAGDGWQGGVVDTGTHEYQAGQRVAMRQSFRTYGSYIEAFADHARLITDNPRYAAVRNAATPEQAARALQDCGYATDPRYADKLISIMNRIDGMTAL